MVTVFFSVAQILLEYNGTIPTDISTMNDFRPTIVDYINANIVDLTTCTAAVDWRYGD
jgi:hypothetical protein